MTRTADVVRLSGDEYDRLVDEREMLRQEAERAWREVDFIAKERTEHLERRKKLANDLDECERIRDALAKTLNELGNDHCMTLKQAKIIDKYGSPQLKRLLVLCERQKMRQKEIMRLFDVSERTAKRDLQALREL